MNGEPTRKASGSAPASCATRLPKTTAVSVRKPVAAFRAERTFAGLRRPAALDGPKYAHTPVALGRQAAGSALDCPLDSGWWFVNVYDARLAQCAYRLARGALKISEWEEYGVPMTALGGGFGPLARDIADKKPGGLRAPFTIFPPKPSAAYYALSANDSGVQRSMLVEPDGMAVPKAGAGRKHVKKAATATHVHLNIITDYRSQKLLVLYTDSKTLGGGAEAANAEGRKPRRTGPPKGHAGVSHSDKPERIVRIPFKRCVQCSSARVEQRRSCTKPVSDLGPDNKVHTVALVVGEGVCLDCGALSKAPTGVLEGTSFGPRLLGAVNEYFHVNCTDAAIARVLERVHGFKTSPNAVLNAREAREPNCLFWIGCIVRARQGWRSGANRQLPESAPGSGIRSSQNRTPRLVGIGTGRRVWPSAEPPWAAPSRGLLPEFAPVPSEAAADTVACHKRCALNPASFSSAAPAIFSASPCRDFGIFKRTLATSFSLVISPRAHLLAAASISWCWYCSPVPYTFGCTRFTRSAAIFSASLRSSAGRWGPILVAIISVAILGFSLSLMMSSTII